MEKLTALKDKKDEQYLRDVRNTGQVLLTMTMTIIMAYDDTIAAMNGLDYGYGSNGQEKDPGPEHQADL